VIAVWSAILAAAAALAYRRSAARD
jgi:hypothetical protein